VGGLGHGDQHVDLVEFQLEYLPVLDDDVGLTVPAAGLAAVGLVLDGVLAIGDGGVACDVSR
jgi:hypothetical protein